MPPSDLTHTQNTSSSTTSHSSSANTHDISTQEHHAKASASGSLNLNLFGALSGALRSASTKTTTRDGSVEERRQDEGTFLFSSYFYLFSHSVLTSDCLNPARGSAVAGGNANAFAAVEAEEGGKTTRESGGAARGESKSVSGSKRVDHLGIEG